MSSVRGRVNTIRSMDDEGVSRAYAKQMARFQAGYDRTADRVHAAAPCACRILDAATGPALGVPRLAQHFPSASIHALDLSPHMLERAKETLESAQIQGRIMLVQGSVYDMPFEDDAFDLVIASQLIHMLDDLSSFLVEARRVLAAGGALLIFDFRRDVPLWYGALAQASTAVLRAFRVPMDGMGPVIKASYTPAELDTGLRAAGFTQVDVTAGLAELRVIAH